jgi:WD40 repeat protein
VWNVLTGRQVLGPLSITGTEASVAISPDARTVAVSVTLGNGNTSLLTQLVDVSNGSLGPLLDAHPQGLFDPIDDPGLRAIVFSADSRLVSSVATSGSATSPDDVATFDVATGARVGGSSVGGTSDSALAVSSDLRALVLSSSSGASVVDTATGATLAEVPIAGAINGGATTPPVAVDPVEPIVAFQVGEGSITLADWAQVGAPHFASLARSGRIAGPVALSPAGAPVGLARPLRLLGLPLQASPHEPWFATASNAGPVAILSSSGIAIWDPATGRITRRLTGIPKDCEVSGIVPNDVAFTGSALTGHVVVSCGNAVMLWSLASPRSTPTWRLPYSGALFNDASIQVSDDGAIVAYVADAGAEIRDGRTGRLRASGPAAGEDEIVNTALSGDGRVLATVLSSGTVVLVDTANGSVLQTLEAQALPIPDNGWPGTIAEPMLAISPDGRFVATWHAVTGVQLWDATTGQSIAVLDGRRIVQTRFEDADASSPGDQVGTLTFNHAGNVLVLKDLQSYPPPSAGGAQTGAPYAVTRTVTWSMRPSDLMQAACAMVRRDLTSAEWDAYVGAGVPYHQTCTPLLAGR